MRPLPDCFLFVFVFGPTVQRDVGAWVNSAQSLRPLPAFVCVVFVPVQRDFVGAWVNSAQSLRLLPYFVCVVFAAWYALQKRQTQKAISIFKIQGHPVNLLNSEAKTSFW